MGDLEDMFLSHVDPKEKKESAVPWGGGFKGNPKTEAKRKAGRRMGPTGSLATMMLLPWVFFCAAMLLFTLRYHAHVWEVYCWVGIGCFISVLTMVSDSAGDGGGWHLYLGMLCLTGLIAGSVTGLYNYQANTFRYWAYDEYRHYTNVLPSEPAAAHIDAGSVQFAQEARVDTTKVIGFKGVGGHVFCLAPILDDSGPGTPVEYWAAGRDCCWKRSKFSCDDVWSPHAKTGVVMREAGGLVPSDIHFYMKAVREAGTTYDLVSARRPLFVSWVLDPAARQAEFWEEADHWMLVAVIVYLVVSLIFGWVLTYSAKSRRRSR